MLSLLPLLAATAAAPAPAVQGQTIRINEIRIDQPSADNDEYFELTGAPGAPLEGFFYIVIGDGAGGSGTIENVTDLTGSFFGANGLFVAAESTFTAGTADLTTTLDFENSDNVTHLIVSGFSGASGDDVDVDDDGVIDFAPWTSIIDSVALVEDLANGEQVYSDTQVGPDGTFVPGHVYLCGDEWNIGIFDITVGLDTPGADNPCPFGEIVCISEANSTGEICEIGLLDDNSAGAMIDFTVSGAPAGEMGFFFAARNFGTVVNPAGFQGVLCAVSDTARFTDSIGMVDVDGNYMATLDTANMPNNPTVPVMAGETWIFQFFYRDENPNPTANFSNALSVTFE